MDTDSDERLAREALRRAYEMHRLPLLRLSTLLLADASLAEDVVQDVFVRSFAAVAALPDDQVGPYLRRSVVNAWKNEVRHRRSAALAAPKLARQESGPEDPVEDRDTMWAAIQDLPPRQRACVVLRYYEDFSDREIARLLGCRIGTVKSQSSRAIAKLRKVVSP